MGTIQFIFYNFISMTTTYHLDADEISIELLNSIKAMFQHKKLNIVVSEAMDETEQLLATKANRESLNRSFKELEEGKGITFTIEEFPKRYGNEGRNIQSKRINP